MRNANIDDLKAALLERGMLKFALAFCEEHNVSLDLALGYTRDQEVVECRHGLWQALITKFELTPRDLAVLLQRLPATVSDALRKLAEVPERPADAPAVLMRSGAGERRDCQREGLCLMEFSKAYPNAHASHCPATCASFEAIPAYVRHEIALTRKGEGDMVEKKLKTAVRQVRQVKKGPTGPRLRVPRGRTHGAEVAVFGRAELRAIRALIAVRCSVGSEDERWLKLLQSADGALGPPGTAQVTFTRLELRAIRELVVTRCTIGAADLRWNQLLGAVEGALAGADEASPGTLVFRMVLPIAAVAVRRGRKTVDVHLAPTMNEYASMPPWKRGIARKVVDERVLAARAAWPSCSARPTFEAKIVKGKVRRKTTGGRRRLVIVTRRSSRRVDEVSVDILGGKLPVDRLKQAEIIADDSKKWIDRRGVWEPAQPGAGEVVIEVFDLNV